MSSTEHNFEDFERSKFLRAECQKLMDNDEPKKAYCLYLTDPLGTRAEYDTFVASYYNGEPT